MKLIPTSILFWHCLLYETWLFCSLSRLSTRGLQNIWCLICAHLEGKQNYRAALGVRNLHTRTFVSKFFLFSLGDAQTPGRSELGLLGERSGWASQDCEPELLRDTVRERSFICGQTKLERLTMSTLVKYGTGVATSILYGNSSIAASGRGR